MTWAEVFSNIIQPILFFGLFIMTFVSMTIAIRAEKRAIERNKQDIIRNAKMIKKNYEILKELAIEHHKLIDSETSNEE